MKFTLAACVVVLAAATLADDTYDPKYDNFDVTTLTGNKRLLTAYVNCFLDKGPCTAEGADFKRVIPEALATKCGKCTPKQKDLVRTVVKALQEQLPAEWAELVKKHDPEGKHKETFNSFLAGN